MRGLPFSNTRLTSSLTYTRRFKVEWKPRYDTVEKIFNKELNYNKKQPAQDFPILGAQNGWKDLSGLPEYYDVAYHSWDQYEELYHDEEPFYSTGERALIFWWYIGYFMFLVYIWNDYVRWRSYHHRALNWRFSLEEYDIGLKLIEMRKEFMEKYGISEPSEEEIRTPHA